ncbi:MFS transporter [Paenibacillus polysaccharolyticus]|uniref:MFS transporter n=1 Tax=Paenibacillus cucumis (ex Kampfer et al. 2016) TaxID=1776858 RepID=A0ABS7KCD9_9BACL|nr:MULTISPECIES: MFS transporter [Paenibacillus]MBY0201793.1 MFS transporter [Paenibacillus cucumis (ex Kampfer et al. 2016)]MCP1134885.1 MFS transporter [Paenibacillus polysaccharolyticus]
MQELFRNPTFLKLFLATFTSQLGNVVGNMAFAYYMVDRFSNQPSLASMAELMYSLPTLAVFWIVGVVADRFDRKHIATYSDWIRALLTLLLLLFVHYDVLFMCFLILFLRSSISKFFGPAEMGLLQGSIGPDQYVHASGLIQIISGVFMLFGLSLGATAYHFIGIEGAIIVDLCSFLLSGFLLAWAKFPEQARMPNGKNRVRDLRFSLVIKDFWQGLQYIIHNRLLLILISGFMFFGIVNGVFSVLPIFSMKYKLSPDQYVVHSSLVTVFMGIGFLIGSILGPILIRRYTRTPILITCLFLASLFLAGLGLVPRVELYFVIILLAGIAIAPINIALGSWLPELVPPQNMGRVNSLIEPVMMLGHSLALGTISLAFPVWINVTWLHLTLAICTVAVSFFYLRSLPGLVRKTTAPATAEQATP